MTGVETPLTAALLIAACVLVTAGLIWVCSWFLWASPAEARSVVDGEPAVAPVPVLTTTHALRRQLLSPGPSVLVGVLLGAFVLWATVSSVFGTPVDGASPTRAGTVMSAD